MIYLDSAATSLLKPPEVARAAARAIGECASPGRGSHEPAMRAADAVLDCRLALAGLFNVAEPERVVFTLNATHALNIAIRSLVSAGNRVVVSGYEHNSVVRPLHALGARISVAASPLFEPEAALAAFRRELPGASAAVCCHVSNVFGYVLPIAEIAAMCRYYGVPLIIDAAQSAGTQELDYAALGADFIAMPGHKGLMGPQGTGVLLCSSAAPPLLYGGTGSDSRSREMPAYYPDRLEAGTHNVCGIAGLLEGVRYVSAKTPTAILEHERRLARQMADGLRGIRGLRVFAPARDDCFSGVLSAASSLADSETLAAKLGAEGVAVRAGLHCAPLAHGTAGTLEGGTVRMSFSPFNTQEEVDKALTISEKIFSLT